MKLGSGHYLRQGGGGANPKIACTKNLPPLGTPALRFCPPLVKVVSGLSRMISNAMIKMTFVGQLFIITCSDVLLILSGYMVCRRHKTEYMLRGSLE